MVGRDEVVPGGRTRFIGLACGVVRVRVQGAERGGLDFFGSGVSEQSMVLGDEEIVLRRDVLCQDSDLCHPLGNGISEIGEARHGLFHGDGRRLGRDELSELGWDAIWKSRTGKEGEPEGIIANQ